MKVTQRPLPVPIDIFVAAMARAAAEDIELSPAPRSREAMIASRPGSVNHYVVGPDSCSCPAGQKSGAFCKHRAAWIYLHIDEYAEALARAYMEGGSVPQPKTA